MTTAQPTGIVRPLAWRVEDTCLNALPAPRQIFYRGWVLRFAGGVTRRANSANPLSAEPDISDALIAGVAALYRRQGLPAIFRLPSLLAPAIDARLAALGYTAEGETCVLHGDLADIPAEPDPEVALLPEPTAEWCAAMAQMQQFAPAHAAAYRAAVGLVAIPAAFAMLSLDGTPAGLAFGAVHDGLLCYESVIVAGTLRRRGLARRIVLALAAWGREQGATGACLQVEAPNMPARTLYDRIGLKSELFRYHYRRAP